MYWLWEVCQRLRKLGVKSIRMWNDFIIHLCPLPYFILFYQAITLSSFSLHQFFQPSLGKLANHTWKICWVIALSKVQWIGPLRVCVSGRIARAIIRARCDEGRDREVLEVTLKWGNNFRSSLPLLPRIKMRVIKSFSPNCFRVFHCEHGHLVNPNISWPRFKSRLLFCANFDSPRLRGQ